MCGIFYKQVLAKRYSQKGHFQIFFDLYINIFCRRSTKYITDKIIMNYLLTYHFTLDVLQKYFSSKSATA